jgi:hypothetical protein
MSFHRQLLPDVPTYFEARGLKLVGSSHARWKTTACVFHGGSDSMRVNTQTGGWCCMACDAKGGDLLAYEMKSSGIEFVEAAKGLGAWVEDGNGLLNTKPAPLPPRAALSVLAFEANLVALAAAHVANGDTLSKADLARVLLAANRISRLLDSYA